MNKELAKNLWWDHFWGHKTHWPNGVTRRRLNKARDRMFDCESLWECVLIVHDGIRYSPSKLRNENSILYQQCVHDMANLIHEHMLELKIIPK